MKFTVDCEINLGVSGIYRLCKDGSWRKLQGDRLILPRDMVFNDVSQVIPYCRSDIEIEINGRIYHANPSEVSFSDMEMEDVVFIEPIVHRIHKPSQFNQEDIREAIRSGDDNKANVLIVDLNGKVKLVERYPGIVEDPRIAVRNETYAPGNGYVGVDAALDDKFIYQEYLAMLGGWAVHLRTGKTNIYVETVPSKSESELLREIRQLTEGLI